MNGGLTLLQKSTLQCDACAIPYELVPVLTLTLLILSLFAPLHDTEITNMHIVHHGSTAAAELFGDEVKYFLKHKSKEVNGKISQVSSKLSPSLEMYVFHSYFT